MRRRRNKEKLSLYAYKLANLCTKLRTHHPTQQHIKTPCDALEGKRRHPGGQEKAPWRAREGTLEGKRRHPGGQEKAPWRAREYGAAREQTGCFLLCHDLRLRPMISGLGQCLLPMDRRPIRHVVKMNDLYIAFNAINQCKRHVRSYIVRYPVIGTVQSALHFTLWQTCLFKLLWKAFSDARRSFVLTSISACSQVLIYTAA